MRNSMNEPPASSIELALLCSHDALHAFLDRSLLLVTLLQPQCPFHLMTLCRVLSCGHAHELPPGMAESMCLCVCRPTGTCMCWLQSRGVCAQWMCTHRSRSACPSASPSSRARAQLCSSRWQVGHQHPLCSPVCWECTRALQYNPSAAFPSRAQSQSSALQDLV